MCSLLQWNKSCALVAVVSLIAGCSKPPPPLVVTLRAESPDASQVHHTIIAVRSAERTLVLNMEVLTPAEFVDYRATLNRGGEKITSEDHLKLSPNDVIRMDLDASLVPPGEYTLVVEARDEQGKIYPFSTYNFRTIR
jgi:hypothetical protein